MRWIPRLLLVIGGLASIATSRAVDSWNIDETEALPPAALDQTESITYPIRIELTGPGPYPSLNGLLVANFALDPRTTPASPTRVTVSLLSTTNPTVPSDDDTVTFLTDAPHQFTLALQAWNGCGSDACAENFDLVIARPAGSAVPFDITGSVEIDASAYDSVAPEGTTVTITVGAPQ